MTLLTTIAPKYDYSSIIKDTAKINWQVSDLIGEERPLDFSKPFLPEALVHTKSLACLTLDERLILNQIRGHSYLNLFGLVEEFILPLVINHASFLGCDRIEATQAYLVFAAEESKHIHLFREFSKAFTAGFGFHCDTIGPPQAIADFVLQHSPLGVALVTLHIEWMTQRHFLDSVRHNQQESLDPQFCSLLKHHWQEEAQHARLDTLMVQELAARLDRSEIEAAIDDYLAIVHYLNEGLRTQVQLDIASLERAIGRKLNALDCDAIQQVQESSYQWVFLGCGMTHPNFVQSVRELSREGYSRIEELSKTFAFS
ncbi:hypothetical protein [Chamaesiphon polymorphus]|uniref:Uncharacterized protein n=1 Tax=Chamaesiphon polymorphus CCALA 037 TaxID=2107692 RepID=A0A2T1GAA5_9CYAN|nr:hypothetical protein [Chamaesiphon polymorphus]PSB54192.1 hypothetical protein C7B77_18910 [Chamaesiphon polymorphus CCALA 037]